MRESQTTEAFLASPLTSRDELTETVGWNCFGFTLVPLSKLGVRDAYS